MPTILLCVDYTGNPFLMCFNTAGILSDPKVQLVPRVALIHAFHGYFVGIFECECSYVFEYRVTIQMLEC